MGIPEVDLGIECAARVIPPARQTRTWTLTAVFFFFFFLRVAAPNSRTSKPRKRPRGACRMRGQLAQDRTMETSLLRTDVRPTRALRAPLVCVADAYVRSLPSHSLPSSPCPRIRFGRSCARKGRSDGGSRSERLRRRFAQIETPRGPTRARDGRDGAGTLQEATAAAVGQVSAPRPTGISTVVVSWRSPLRVLAREGAALQIMDTTCDYGALLQQ